MILTMIGCVWIVSGGLFLWKPNWLKRRLRKKGMRYVRRLMLTSYFFVAGSLFGLAAEIGRFVAYFGALALSIVLFIYLFKLYRRMSQHASESFEKVEDKIILRVAIAYIVAGLILVLGSNQGLFK